MTGPREPADRDAVARASARLFATADGRLVLAHLRRQTIDRVLGPDTSSRALRFLEGQRALVRRLESLIATGRASPVVPHVDDPEKEKTPHG